MDAQAPNPPYAVPPPFSPSTPSHRSSSDMPKPVPMDLDMSRTEQERSTRAASVLSGMSVEDMEAAETLNSLQQKYHSPQQQQAPPIHVQTTTSFDQSQSEPLLRLFTSQYPLAGSLINGSLSAYKTTQSYIPGAEWTERNVGLPIAGKVAKISGVEGGLRWYLQPKRGRKSSSTTRTPDVERGYTEPGSNEANQPGLEIAYAETLPAYNDGDRSPPYSEEHQLAVKRDQRQPPPGWRQQLVISTSGLGVAMSEESLRSLRFCLNWLRWANGRLGEAIQNLKALMERWNEGMTPGEQASPMSVANMTQGQDDRRQAVLAHRIAALRKDVLDTLKQVVGIVSNYAGGALPQNARDLVHRHLTSLPQRFNVANAMIKDDEDGNEAENSANRVMVLAQEGLDMMTQVSRVVNDTLVSAEGWCEKLGRKTGREQGQLEHAPNEKQPFLASESRERSMTASNEQDVKMEM